MSADRRSRTSAIRSRIIAPPRRRTPPSILSVRGADRGRNDTPAAVPICGRVTRTRTSTVGRGASASRQEANPAAGPPALRGRGPPKRTKRQPSSNEIAGLPARRCVGAGVVFRPEIVKNDGDPRPAPSGASRALRSRKLAAIADIDRSFARCPSRSLRDARDHRRRSSSLHARSRS